MLTPAIRAFCDARSMRVTAPLLAVPSKAAHVDVAERDYWLGMASVGRGDFAGARAAAIDGLARLKSVNNDELRWRLAAVAAIVAKTANDEAQRAALLEEARTALARVRRALGPDATAYGSRPDFVYLNKLAGL